MNGPPGPRRSTGAGSATVQPNSSTCCSKSGSTTRLFRRLVLVVREHAAEEQEESDDEGGLTRPEIFRKAVTKMATHAITEIANSARVSG